MFYLNLISVLSQLCDWLYLCGLTTYLEDQNCTNKRCNTGTSCGLAIACRPSVRLSVTLVDCDHIGWKSWKLTARIISPTLSLFAAKRRSTYFQGNMGKFWGDWRCGIGKKWHAGEQKRQYLWNVKIEEKLLWTAYRNSRTLFRMVPSPTPYRLPFSKIGGSQPPLKTAI